MGKLIKFIGLVALVAALAGGGSYAAAYFAQGKIAGVDDVLGQRAVKLNWEGVDSLPGKPRAWVFTYSGGKLQGLRTATIWVTPTGTLIATKPKDLRDRVDHWRDSQQTAD